ncbi:hypothetical protein [Zobellella iuensis]|uniref:Cell division inhibitor SulA n=1 Tax=Zobellella iuensis TaxID=2803811 RepID=A0ABS1QSL5_9GAMM|nr:hypothetical protein [Zobellella iuensis]MBL1377103.1 hypothetical protein [Zobellella iuensis]
MATILLTRNPELPSLPGQWHGTAVTHTVAAPGLIERIDDWSAARQRRLLAELAAISQRRCGWILTINTPAPLSRHALAAMGVAPAHVVDMGKVGANLFNLVQRAISHKGIAAVVCWQCRPAAEQQRLLELAAQRHRNKVFLIAASREAALLH